MINAKQMDNHQHKKEIEELRKQVEQLQQLAVQNKKQETIKDDLAIQPIQEKQGSNLGNSQQDGILS